MPICTQRPNYRTDESHMKPTFRGGFKLHGSIRFEELSACGDIVERSVFVIVFIKSIPVPVVNNCKGDRYQDDLFHGRFKYRL